MVAVIHGDAYAHLAGAHHINARLVALEDLEHLTQEAVSQEHAARLNLYAGDAILGSHGLDGTLLHLVVDDGARCRGVHGVE